MYHFLSKGAYGHSLSALLASSSDHRVVPNLAPLLAVCELFSELRELLAQSLSYCADRLNVNTI